MAYLQRSYALFGKIRVYRGDLGPTSKIHTCQSIMAQTSIGILGAGFALYGYLPAAIQKSWEVHTLEKYRNNIERRSEIAGFLDKLNFHPNETALLKSVDCLVMARDPNSQSSFLHASLPYSGHLFLEKPLGKTIVHHKKLLRMLVSAEARFSLGYIFPFTSWYEELAKLWCNRSCLDVQINWQIRSPESVWKLTEETGGGLANYYFIHFIPLLMELSLPGEILEIKYRRGHSIKVSGCIGDRAINIEVSFQSKSLFDCRVLDCQGFVVTQVLLDSPFGELPTMGEIDPRIPHISRYLEENYRRQDRQHSITIEREIIEFRSRTQ